MDPTEEWIDLVIQVKENPCMSKFFISGSDNLSEEQIKKTFDSYRNLIPI